MSPRVFVFRCGRMAFNKEFEMTVLRRLLAAMGFLFAGQIAYLSPADATVTLGISDWPGWVAWYVAEHNGYLKKYGADVKLVWFPSYMTSVEALSAGQIDANCQALIDTLAPLEKKIPIKVILVTDNSAGNDALMVKNSITSYPQLRGKTIAVEMNSIENYLAVTALEQHDVPPAEVHFVNMSTGDAAAALITGKVDGAGVWNPWLQRIEARKAGHPLFTSAEAPGLIPDIVAVREKALVAHRKDFIALAKAWFATVRFINEHPNKAAAIMAPHVDLPPKEYALSLAGTRLFGAKLNKEAMAPGKSPISLYNSTVDTSKFLISAGMIKAVPVPKEFVDASLVDEAMKP